MNTAKVWKKNDLKGLWLFTWKIDGVRVLVNNGVAISRTGKSLYHVPTLRDGDYECYCGSFKKTIQALKTIEGDDIDVSSFYSINPVGDRLIIGAVNNPTADYITLCMSNAIRKGYEGLVLRQGDKWLKVKPIVTHDLRVQSYVPGKGKHAGRMGALLTEMGKVGTGFTDAQREEYTEEYIVGKVVELQAMGITAAGKLRHPRFVRLREDKS